MHLAVTMNFTLPHTKLSGTWTILLHRGRKTSGRESSRQPAWPSRKRGGKRRKNGLEKYCSIHSSKCLVPQQHKTISSATLSCSHMAPTLTITQWLLELSVAAGSITFPQAVCSHNQTQRTHLSRAQPKVPLRRHASALE